jgi:hypothetical protein
VQVNDGGVVVGQEASGLCVLQGSHQLLARPGLHVPGLVARRDVVVVVAARVQLEAERRVYDDQAGLVGRDVGTQKAVDALAHLHINKKTGMVTGKGK